MATGTLTSKGQITIPAEVRDALGLEAGSQIDFEVVDGRLIGHRVITIRESDRWMLHDEVVAAMERSARDLEEGRVSPALSADEFLEQLDSV
jgi:AbrB family looped-hinge helix DNA binding protein